MNAFLPPRAFFALTAVWLALCAAASAQDSDADGSSSDAEPSDTANAQSAQTADASAEPQQKSSDGQHPRMQAQAFGGLGFGSRSFERPTPLGAQKLPTVFFPAADIGLRVMAWPKDRFSLEFLLRYQSSIGMTVDERPPFALPNQIAARVERGELSVAPTFRLGGSESAPAIAFPAGLEIRTFWPEVHESPSTAGYSLIGPHIRAELIAPLTSMLLLRFGPELQWIIAIDRSIREDGVANQGFSAGGEAMVQLRLGAVFALELCYRESHAFASSTNAGPIFSDVERYLSGRLSGTF
jgi:hypothetical protein